MKNMKTELLFKTIFSLPRQEKPIFFMSEEDVNAVIETAFGIFEASESDLTKERNRVKWSNGQMVQSSGLIPEPLEIFEDTSSDEGISQMAFYGIGQALLKKSAEVKPAAYEGKE